MIPSVVSQKFLTKESLQKRSGGCHFDREPASEDRTNCLIVRDIEILRSAQDDRPLPKKLLKESLGHDTRGRHAIDVIWSTAASGQLGTNIATLCSPTRRDALLSLAESLGRNVPTMERGYTHNEYTPEQIGRRPETGEMVVFDLRTTGLGPRFVDVAPWLGVPNRVLKRGHKTRELADHYLQQYLGAGGESVPLDTLMGETRMLWQASIIAGLNRWSDCALAGIESSKEEDSGRSTCQDRLLVDLTQLLETLPKG